MIKLLLARHGNTFNPEDKTVWTGSSNDLPLVAKGIQQAQQAGAWLKNNNFIPDVVYAGSLQRVRDFAKISLQEAELNNKDIHQDPRLNEIDYGAWTGLSDDEVVTRFGESDLTLWREESVFPAQGWHETAQQVESRIKDFVDFLKTEHENKNIYVVSSNGTLRYFLKALDENLFKHHIQTKNFAVKTGHLCLLEIKENKVQLVFWNKSPA